MSTSRKPRIRNSTLDAVWFLRYYAGMTTAEIYELAYSMSTSDSGFKNHWLQKRANRQKIEERWARIEQIANNVSKYISSRKAKDGSI